MTFNLHLFLSMSHLLIKKITSEYTKHADNVKAASASKYLHDQFPFYGLTTPVRRSVCKAFFKAHPVTTAEELEQIVKEAFNCPQREMHYFGIELLGYHRTLWNKKTYLLLEWMITHKSWWDSVDSLNSFVLSKYFQDFPELKEKINRKWNRSSNIWLQRSSILFQLLYKEKTDLVLLEEYILNSIHEKEFFIQKAIGWALRQYAYTDKKWVKEFVKKHPEISRLSKREALKHISK